MSGAFIATAILVALCLIRAADNIRTGSIFHLAVDVVLGALFITVYMLRVIQ